MLSLLAQSDGSFWMQPQASTMAAEVDWVFYLVYWISVFFFVLITATLVVFVIKYRQRPGHVAKKSPRHSTHLELTWTIIPTLIVLVIFFYGFRTFLHASTAPQGAYEIVAEGMKWKWNFRYPNGYVDGTLHVPRGRPVRLVLKSNDVTHSLFIPAFRAKMDVVPGRYNKMWFEASKLGEYDLYCAEYCGQGHSEMITKVIVHDETAFVGWLNEATAAMGDLPPAERGKRLYEQYCISCHKLDSGATYPQFNDLYGSERVSTTGATRTADEAYIRESILNPGAFVVQGYPNAMQPYAGILDDDQIMALITFLKSISEHFDGELDAGEADDAQNGEADDDGEAADEAPDARESGGVESEADDGEATEAAEGGSS